MFLFHFKSSFRLKKNKFYNSTFLNFMTPWNAEAWNKYISLNNLGSKYSLLMKFGQYVIL